MGPIRDDIGRWKFRLARGTDLIRLVWYWRIQGFDQVGLIIKKLGFGEIEFKKLGFGEIIRSCTEQGQGYNWGFEEEFRA